MTGPSRLALAYHAVCDDWDDPLSVRPAELERQLRELAEAGYAGVRFSELARPAQRPVVAITFDDGLRSVLRATVLLDRLGWPATVFVPTSAVERREPMTWLLGRDGQRPSDPDELSTLGWEELQTLAERGWEIGSHGATHRRLSMLDDGERRHELESSRSAIVQRLGRCSSVSYPWGETHDDVILAARAAGFTAGGGLEGRFVDDDPLQIPRFAVARDDVGLRFALKTSAAVWAFRATRGWDLLEHVRRPRDLEPESDLARST